MESLSLYILLNFRLYVLLFFNIFPKNFLSRCFSKLPHDENYSGTSAPINQAGHQHVLKVRSMQR